ncbi:MAG: Gfo/Idh/MocA family protein [Candidatus Bipolaricaulota bacterium]
MEKIRLGIAGCGIAARRLHWPALEKLDEYYRIVGVTNRTKEKAVSFAELAGGAEVFDSYKDLIASEKLDAVDLALPIELNPDFIEKAAAKGIDVICEKPIAPDVERGVKVVDLADNTDSVIYIAENFRHHRKLEKARELIEAGEIGEPLFVHRREFVGMTNENEFARTGWRKEPEHVGGFLSDGGVHHVAGLRRVLGEIIGVSGYVTKVSDLPGKYDSMTLNLKFKNGVLGNYLVSYGIGGDKQYRIWGEEGSIEIEDGFVRLIDGEQVETFDVDENDGFLEEFRDFYEVVKGDKTNNLGNPREALMDLAVIEAGIKSAEDSRRVDVRNYIQAESTE